VNRPLNMTWISISGKCTDSKMTATLFRKISIEQEYDSEEPKISSWNTSSSSNKTHSWIMNSTKEIKNSLRKKHSSKTSGFKLMKKSIKMTTGLKKS